MDLFTKYFEGLVVASRRGKREDCGRERDPEVMGEASHRRGEIRVISDWSEKLKRGERPD